MFHDVLFPLLHCFSLQVSHLISEQRFKKLENTIREFRLAVCVCTENIYQFPSFHSYSPSTPKQHTNNQTNERCQSKVEARGNTYIVYRATYDIRTYTSYRYTVFEMEKTKFTNWISMHSTYSYTLDWLCLQSCSNTHYTWTFANEWRMRTHQCTTENKFFFVCLLHHHSLLLLISQQTLNFINTYNCESYEQWVRY